jgi:serine/threonine protein phosphatase PrpC
VAGDTDPAETAQALVALANARGGEDNVTVALVRCDGEAEG